MKENLNDYQMANEQNLIRFEKGQSGNPNGRPKKYVTLLRDAGYKKSEINDTIQTMMALTLKEVTDIRANEDSTMLEKTIANAMIVSLKKGSLYSMDTLLDRVYGKPKEESELKQSGRIEVVFIKGKTIL